MGRASQLHAATVSEHSDRFTDLFGTRRGSGRAAEDPGAPQTLLFAEAEAAEVLRQVISHGVHLQPSCFQTITLNRHPQIPGERLHVVSFGNFADNLKAAVAIAAKCLQRRPADFVVIIFTDRENGTSIILNASGNTALSNPTVPA